MTRQERKEEKLKKERAFIDSIKGMVIDGKIKELFRRTSIWTDFRKRLKAERKVDFLTGRKLTKTWNCHHMRFDPREYTDLDERYFRCYNNQIHDLVHLCVSETIKNPDFMKKLMEEVKYHIALNDGKDIKDYIKEVKNGKSGTDS